MAVGPLASHRPQAQLVAAASPPAILWAPPPLTTGCLLPEYPPFPPFPSATHRNFHRHRVTGWGRTPPRPTTADADDDDDDDEHSIRLQVPRPFPVSLLLVLYGCWCRRAKNSVDLFVCLFVLFSN